MGASGFIPERLDPSSPAESAAILGAGAGPAIFFHQCGRGVFHDRGRGVFHDRGRSLTLRN